MNVQRSIPVVDSTYFPVLANGPQLNGVWTSDRTAWHSEFQWVVGFGDQAYLATMQCRKLDASAPPCDEYPWGRTDFTASVVLVNGSWRQPPPPAPLQSKTLTDDDRWQVRNDGLTVTDAVTGLTWDRCSWGQVGPTCVGHPTIFPYYKDSMQIAAVANASRYKGFHDWRLPNVRELETLVKIDGNPAIDMNVFPNTLIADNHSDYVTSSQYEPVPGISNAYWYVEFANGTVGNVDKEFDQTSQYPNVSAVRLVRGGLDWEPFDGVSDRLFWSDFEGSPSAPTAH
jgi:hypothetical protein